MARALRGLAVVAALTALTALGGCADEGDARPAARREAPTLASGTAAPATAVSTSTSTTSTTVPPVPSTDRRLVLEQTITGPISPKSVVASGTGLVFAQNMMYQHTVTAYRSDGTLAATIPDTVDLAAFGIAGHPGEARGAPVEVAFSPDGRHAYVSNYAMYGAGFGPEGSDSCGPGNNIDASFLYRIDTDALKIDAVAQVGAVPKYVAVTPDARYVLVSNWCSYDLSVVDAGTMREVQRVPLGRYPRGIVVDPASTTAYVAVMGSQDIARVDLATFAVSWIRGVGSGPRHVVIDPAGRFLYATLNGDGRVAKVDLSTSAVVARVATGSAPRSMAISADGLSLYVGNYSSNTVSKLRADDLTILQTVDTGTNPIGITYDRTTSKVWVANYSGSIEVFADQS